MGRKIIKNNDYLNTNDIALKYNCRFQTVTNFASKNSVPFDFEKYGERKVRSFKFYPEHEALFANRKKINCPTRLLNTRTCLLIYSKKNTLPLVMAFQTLNKAFRYSVNLFSGKLTFFSHDSVNFKRYIKTAPDNIRTLILSFIKKTPPKGKWFSLLSFDGSMPIPFYFDDSDQKINIIHSLSSKKHLKLICVEQKKNESNSDFCGRILSFNTIGDEFRISLSSLHKVFPNIKGDFNVKNK